MVAKEVSTTKIAIREETTADAAVITEVTVAAFATMEISNHTEQFIIFENVPGLVHEGVPQEVFFSLSFDGHFPQGDVIFHEGFKANGQQGAPGMANRRR